MLFKHDSILNNGVFKNKTNNLLKKSCFSLVAYSLINISSFAQASEIKAEIKTTLMAKPAKCITLNQGRTCFSKVILTWQIADARHMCIYQKQPKKMISCWQGTPKNQLEFEFQSSETLTYQLINQQQKVLAETSIDVNWVYEASPRKRRWRVF